MRRRGYRIETYPDNFLVLGETFAPCSDAHKRYTTMDLGFVVNWGKVMGPSRRIPFLG